VNSTNLTHPTSLSSQEREEQQKIRLSLRSPTRRGAGGEVKILCIELTLIFKSIKVLAFGQIKIAIPPSLMFYKGVMGGFLRAEHHLAETYCPQ
jgi:hypothetical protein